MSGTTMMTTEDPSLYVRVHESLRMAECGCHTKAVGPFGRWVQCPDCHGDLRPVDYCETPDADLELASAGLAEVAVNSYLKGF